MSIVEKKTTPQQKYDAINTTRYQLKLNNKTDKDIIDKLNTVESKQGYIKECIRKDLKEKNSRVLRPTKVQTLYPRP